MIFDVDRDCGDASDVLHLCAYMIWTLHWLAGVFIFLLPCPISAVEVFWLPLSIGRITVQINSFEPGTVSRS